MKKMLCALGMSLLVAGGAQATLIFQMDFNDADGNQSMTDRGTTGATGSFGGNATYSTDVASVNSGGYSGSFDGTSGAADFGDINALDGLTAMTITAWVKSTHTTLGGPSGSARIVSKRTGANGHDLYYHDTDNELEFVANSSPVANGGGAISAGAWTWIAVTYNGSNATFYTGDGTTLSAGDTVALANGAINSNAEALLIGDRAGGGRTFKGLIDNVRIYNSVEDSASLSSIMQFNDVIPEPTTFGLLGVGAGLLMFIRRRLA